MSIGMAWQPVRDRIDSIMRGDTDRRVRIWPDGSLTTVSAEYAGIPDREYFRRGPHCLTVYVEGMGEDYDDDTARIDIRDRILPEFRAWAASNLSQ